MKIQNGPGDIQHCCRCGSMQFKFDVIQHRQYCEEIRNVQDFKKCQWHTKEESKKAMANIIYAIDNITE